MGRARCRSAALGSASVRPSNNRHSRDGAKIRGGGRRWVPVCTGMTGGGGRTPQSSFARRRESTAGGRRWVPVCTGTTGGGGAPTIVIPATAGIRGGGAGDGFPSARERRAAAGAPTIVLPATAGIRGGGRRWVPVCTGTTGGDRRTHNRHSRDGGNPRWGAGDGFPSARERRAAAGAPTIVIPATAGIHGGGPAMGSRLHGNDGRRRAHPQSSFPRRRESTAGGRRWVPVCTGTTGGGGRTHNRHSREGGNPGLGPAMGSRLH